MTSKLTPFSALQGSGVDNFWNTVQEYRQINADNGHIAQRRQDQSLAWMWERIDAGLKQAFRQNAGVRDSLPQFTEQVRDGKIAASTAARQLLQAFQGQTGL